MAIAFTCPCGRDLELPAHLAGRRVQCPACRRTHTAPEPDDAGPSYALTAEPPAAPVDAVPEGEFRDPAVREAVRKALEEREEEKEREWLRHHGGSRYNRPMIEGLVACFIGCLMLLFGTVLPCFWYLAPLVLIGAGVRYYQGHTQLHE